MKFAIYGFYFDKEFSFDGIKFTPVEELSYRKQCTAYDWLNPAYYKAKKTRSDRLTDPAALFL